MDPLLLEAIRAALQIAIRAYVQAGLTREELDAEYNKQWEEFKKKDPNDLPDV
ncbi:unnamed protein product [marine sediment metagenome]|uniref:Uncharacterized protein n=1 Tax=marine sediment metagenome TaxID=412755 RepID=X0RZ76_9ZZZZ